MERTTTLVANPGCINRILFPKRRTLRRTGRKYPKSQPTLTIDRVYDLVGFKHCRIGQKRIRRIDCW